VAKISQSNDRVSQRLSALFDNPIEPSLDELERARQRREAGNPPGKPANPLGDQIVWEQLLTRCRKAERNAVWVISADKDYGTASGNTLLLNPLLHHELIQVCQGALDLRCFVDLSEGLIEFAKSVGETKLPSQNERQQIKQEIEFWNANTSFDPTAVITAAHMQRNVAAILSANTGLIWTPVPPKDLF
jgi:hypothetical protein